jgi:hypothetical protein
MTTFSIRVVPEEVWKKFEVEYAKRLYERQEAERKTRAGFARVRPVILK